MPCAVFNLVNSVCLDLASSLMICPGCESVCTVTQMVLTPYSMKDTGYLSSLRGLRFAGYLIIFLFKDLLLLQLMVKELTEIFWKWFVVFFVFFFLNIVKIPLCI